MIDRIEARDYVLWNLREAIETLEGLVRDLDADANYDEHELRVALSHAYSHLNTAWNARAVCDEHIESCSDDDFRRWRQYPTDLCPSDSD